MEAQKPSQTSSSSSRTNIVIEGTGISITYLKTDQESFELLTEVGVTEAGLQLLIDQIDAGGVGDAGLFIDDLKVTVSFNRFGRKKLVAKIAKLESV